MPSFPFPMKSKRFKNILLALDLGLVAALIGCATQGKAPATEGPSTQSAPQQGWAFADTQRPPVPASPAEVAEAVPHTEIAEGKPNPEDAKAPIIGGEDGPTAIWMASSPEDIVETLRKFIETNPEAAKELFSSEIVDIASVASPSNASTDANVAGEGSGEAEPSPVVVPPPSLRKRPQPSQPPLPRLPQRTPPQRSQPQPSQPPQRSRPQPSQPQPSQPLLPSSFILLPWRKPLQRLPPSPGAPPPTPSSPAPWTCAWFWRPSAPRRVSRPFSPRASSA